MVDLVDHTLLSEYENENKAKIRFMQLDVINRQFDEPVNKHDAVAAAALYTEKATIVTPLGVFSGREGIEKYFTDLFQRYNPSDQLTKLSYVYAFGGDLCAIGGWTVTANGSLHSGGYLTRVYPCRRHLEDSSGRA